jgi:hypothetical protein
MGTESVMQGGGSYNAHSHPQQDAARTGIERLAAAARTMPVAPGAGAITIADYGASQGHNSLAPMGAAIDAARDAHGDGLTISVVHTDLPGNDFSSLFETVVHDPATYLRPGVFGLATGRSFYEQLLPSGSVSLGWSSIAVHWLSTAPVPMERGIWSPLAAPAVREAWAAQSAQDWSAFLDARAAELRPGARLVVVGSGADAHGASGAEGALELVDRCLRELVTPEEHAGLRVPTWYRTPAEWEAGFPHPDLELEESAASVLPDPFWPAFAASGDAAAYADAAAAFLRAAFEPALLGPLAPDRRSAIGDALFARRLPALIAVDPAAASCRWRLRLLVIRRR